MEHLAIQLRSATVQCKVICLSPTLLINSLLLVRSHPRRMCLREEHGPGICNYKNNSNDNNKSSNNNDNDNNNELAPFVCYLSLKSVTEVTKPMIGQTLRDNAARFRKDNSLLNINEVRDENCKEPNVVHTRVIEQVRIKENVNENES